MLCLDDIKCNYIYRYIIWKHTEVVYKLKVKKKKKKTAEAVYLFVFIYDFKEWFCLLIS